MYINIDNNKSAADNPNVKNSFMAVTTHFGLIFSEHVILVIIMYHDEAFMSHFGHQHVGTFCWVPFVLWIFATGSMFIYYKFCNKARFLRDLGPELPCKVKCNSCQTKCVGLLCWKVQEVRFGPTCESCFRPPKNR